MALYHEDIVNIELECGNIYRSFLSHTIGYGDDDANRFGIRAYRNGEPETLGGNCIGLFIRADGETVPIEDGVVSGNVAYVTLPPACYAVEGQFSLTIKVSGGGVTGTMRIVDGVVSRTSTSAVVDPGMVIPSIEDLIDAIDAAVASIPADYTGLWTSLAPAFSSSTAYTKGQYVTYDGKLYRFTTDHSAGTWNSSHATQVSIGPDLAMDVSEIKKDITETNSLIEGSTGTEKITDFSRFTTGSISFSNDGTMTYDSTATGFKFIILYDVDYLSVETAGYVLYMKQVPVSNGTHSETITIQNSRYESSTRANYVITCNSSVSGTKLEIYCHHFQNEVKEKYTDKAFYNAAFRTVVNYSNSDCFEFGSSIRCLTKRICSNRIKVKSNSGYRAAVYVLKNGAISEARSPIVGDEAIIYDANAEWYFVVASKYDNTQAITPQEAERNIFIEPCNLSSSVDVVYFTTKVPISGTVYDDHGILVLPENYSEDGEPLRLCIVCHGAGAVKYEAAYATMDETGKILGDPQRVLTKKGYAVMDCYAAPYDYVGETSTSLGLHYGNPSVVTCYQKAYEYVTKNFNVKKDGILLFASSMGGLALSQIARNSVIPVLSAVGYCPCLDMFKQAWCNTWQTNGRYNIARLFGFEGTAPEWTNGWANLTEDEKEYFYDNIDKVIGYYPILYGTTAGSFDEIKSVMPAAKYGDAPAEKAVYDTFRGLYNVPFKIIHCTDDSTMASRYSEYFIGMLKRNGQLAEIKMYQSGGHAAWAAGSDVTTKDIWGNNFTCKDSQMEGLNFAIRFDR